ncbi:MAG TPA: hypothetical protein PKH09_00330 [Parvularculaceae bacterium]|nr:hypothetical protein [Parvularculaceae bacterium]
MALNAFSVVGESLNFSMRRFETVIRVAALPLVLLLIFNMAATFGYLSIANERIITFKDVAGAGLNWAQVSRLGARAAQATLNANSATAWAIYVSSLLMNAMLVASFMAPLVRYAGLGERPAPGLLRAPFGADQMRYLAAGAFSTVIFIAVVYAPITVATASIVAFISQAMTTPFATFPNPDSLHTIEIIAGADMFGFRWLRHYQVWGAAAVLAGIVVIALFVIHFRPSRRAAVPSGGFASRVIGVVVGFAAYLAIALFLFVTASKMLRNVRMTTNGNPVESALNVDALAAVLFGAVALAFAAYFSLRLFPYSGIATCRKSMAFKGLGRVTRRYNLFRLALAFVLLGVILFGMQIVLVWIGGGSALAVIGYLATAAESYARLVGGPDAGGWVFPFFAWLWAMIGIIFTLMWAAFTYGVTAGLWGRLYRESLREG